MKRLILISSIIFIFLMQSCVVHTRKRNTVPKRTKVVYVKKIPRNHKTVIIKGKKYYYFNGKHHLRTNKGYKVVVIK